MFKPTKKNQRVSPPPPEKKLGEKKRDGKGDAGGKKNKKHDGEA